MHRTVEPDERHHAFKRDVDELLKKHSEKLQAVEVLALASQLVGMIIAFQDQQTMTSDRAMKIVSLNIETGNKMAVVEVNRTIGNG